MAELQSLQIDESSSFVFPTASNTTDVGYIWFNDSSSVFEYSGWSGDGIIAKELGNSSPSSSGSAPSLYEFTSNTFTNASTTGYLGPSLSNCQTAYSGQAFLSGYFTVSNGVQFWTVPSDGNYSFTIQGATGGKGGGDSSYGKPARCTGTYTLSSGDVVRIVVGQVGINGAGTCSGAGGGGGGATAVSFGTTAGNSNGTIIAIAGGGGGGSTGVDAGNAQITQGSLASNGSPNSAVPTTGYGGLVAGGCVNSGNGGGGWLGAGTDEQSGGGGEQINSSLPNGGNLSYKDGGFGGGGASGPYAAGGGGGYTGGCGGGLPTCSCSNLSGGTGGGSINNLSSGVTSIITSAALGTHGYVTITAV
jgi:hypothetical protein